MGGTVRRELHDLRYGWQLKSRAQKTRDLGLLLLVVFLVVFIEFAVLRAKPTTGFRQVPAVATISIPATPAATPSMLTTR